MQQLFRLYLPVATRTVGTPLLSMVEELPYFDEAVPLTRLGVFSTADNTMSLNMFVYGNKATVSVRPIDSEAVQKILKVAADVQEGKYAGAPHHLEPHPQFDKEALLQYLQKCSDNYLNIISRRPERFFRQKLMFDAVSGTEGCEVHVEPAKDDPGHYWVDAAVVNALPQVALEHTC